MNAVIDNGFSHYIYEFAKNVEGADLEKLTDAIIETKNTEYIELFADYFDVFADKVPEAAKEKLMAEIQKSKVKTKEKSNLPIEDGKFEKNLVNKEKQYCKKGVKGTKKKFLLERIIKISSFL